MYESFHLGSAKETEYQEEGINIHVIRHTPGAVARAIRNGKPDLLYLPWSALPFISRVKEKLPIVIDYVGSGLLEELAATGKVPAYLLKLTLDSFWRGDFLMTSGARFRLFILALLVASKRTTLGKVDPEDPLIHLIPMGLPPGALPVRAIEKKIRNGVRAILAGATLPWYDYLTLFEGLKKLGERRNLDFEMVFMGGNPRNPSFEKSIKTQAEKIGSHVSFTGIVPFKKRGSFYQEADVALNIAKPTLEDELSIRTRIYDYLWGGLPVLTCGRDEYSDLVLREGAGIWYEPGNIELKSRTSSAITRVRAMIDEKANNIQPLEKFLEDPYVDPKRKSTARFLPSTVLYLRDFLRSVRN